MTYRTEKTVPRLGSLTRQLARDAMFNSTKLNRPVSGAQSAPQQLWQTLQTQAQLQVQLQRLLPKNLQVVTQIYAQSAQTLSVLVPSAANATQLNFMSKTILTQLNEHNGSMFTKLIVKVRPVRGDLPAVKKRVLTPAGAQALRACRQALR